MAACHSLAPSPSHPTRAPAPNTLWRDMDHHFQFTADYQQPAVQTQLQQLRHHHAYFTLLSQHAKPYLYYIYTETKQRHMPAEVALLPMIESNYDPFSFSPQGATGLWQMMPGTATGFGLPINWWYDGRRDVLASTQVALHYLTYLHQFFHDWMLAIAAYNAGEGTVQQAIRHNRAEHLPTDYWHLALPAETKNYVPKVLAVAAVIHQRDTHPISLAPIPLSPAFLPIQLTHQYNLDHLAKIANISPQTLRHFNPGFRRFATPPQPHLTLLVPTQAAATLHQALALSQPTSLHWQHHRIQPGDTLLQLAHHYATRVDVIKKINHLDSNQLALNQSLLIPQSASHLPQHTFKLSNKTLAEDHLPGPTRITYTVAKHDTLNSISRSFHIKPRDIQFWNKLPSTHLKPKQQLILWQPHITARPAYRTHTIHAHDTLIHIAKHNHITVKALKKLNHLDSDFVRVGKTLKLPRPEHSHFTPQYHHQMVVHRVQAGESINSIAHYFQISSNDLARWNHLKPKQYLKLYQPLVIYLHKK